MTANVIAACKAAGTRRLVFASSNHVVGAYFRQGATLDPPQAPLITPETPPHPDRFQAGPHVPLNDFTAYAAAKIAGESMCAAAVSDAPGGGCGVFQLHFTFSDALLAACQCFRWLNDSAPTGICFPWSCFFVLRRQACASLTIFCSVGACCTCSLLSKGLLSAIAVRIGWCQPGENLPQTMTAGGSPTTVVDMADGSGGIAAASYAPEVLGYDRNDELLRWFRLMWLSNADMGQLFVRCIEYDATADTEPNFMVVNGMSRNTGRRWSDCNYQRSVLLPLHACHLNTFPGQTLLRC